MAKLEKGSIVKSPVTERRYRIGEVIGAGGYGKAFRAIQQEKRAVVCLKYTLDQTSWLRESYFGELLRGEPRVVQVYDAFPVTPSSGRGRIRYCVVLEMAENGTVADYLKRTAKPFAERRARREIVAILRVLERLHGSRATHRDITPFNVFVTKHGVLKLGDFGIARHELAGRASPAEAFNPDFVTRGVIEEEHRAWTAADDVYQVGQLFALLLLGSDQPVSRAEVRRSPIGRELRSVILRAIGPRARRYRDAGAMRRALSALGHAPLPSRRAGQ